MTDRWWQRPLVKPRALRPGDRVAIVSTSWGGPAVFPYRYEAGKRYLADAFGLAPVEMPHALREADWLDQNPQARAEDIHAAFSDPSIRGVIASIGGDDAIRLIRHIDLSLIADNPKVFLGYSDPTVLHFGCLKAGLCSFYGPTIMSGFAENGGMPMPRTLCARPSSKMETSAKSRQTWKVGPSSTCLGRIQRTRTGIGS